MTDYHEITDYQILAITTAYEQGVGKGRQSVIYNKEITNPYGPGFRCDLAWDIGYKEGKKQADRWLKTESQNKEDFNTFAKDLFNQLKL